jgi:hypothetical protein
MWATDYLLCGQLHRLVTRTVIPSHRLDIEEWRNNLIYLYEFRPVASENCKVPVIQVAPMAYSKQLC